MGQGRFIVFEGVDHCGKTTQIDLATRWLKDRGHDVLRLREPGGTLVGERIRDVLLDKSLAITPLCEMLLFMASRVQLLDKQITPALETGRDVVLDRYWYSTAAYQGAAGELGLLAVLDQAKLLRLRTPDLVVMLDGDPEQLASRHRGEADRIEAKGLEYQFKVREGYRALAKMFDSLFRVINAEETVETVHVRVTEVLVNEKF